jgi:hypothetical protein
MSGQQQSYIYYFNEDNAGNFSPDTYEWVSIDTTAPVTTATLGGTLSGGIYHSAVQVSLNATDTGGSGVQYTYYQLDGGATTTYSGAAFTATALGSHTVKYWSVDSAGNTEATKTTTFTIATAPGALSTPAPGTVLAGSSVAFTWTPGYGVQSYQLNIGTLGVGSTDVYSSGHTSALSASVTGIPTYGQKLYARLWSEIGGVWSTADYTYTEAGSPLLAALTSPAPSSVLPGANVTFTWTVGGGVKSYQLELGTLGVGSSNVFNSGHTPALSVNVTGIPTYGQKIYARLYSESDAGIWSTVDYLYTEAGSPVPAVLTTPAPGSTLTGSTATFKWTAGGGVVSYQLNLGTTGVGSSNLYTSGHTTATSAAVTGLPTTGVKIYARLYSDIAGTWSSIDYTYTAQ